MTQGKDSEVDNGPDRQGASLRRSVGASQRSKSPIAVQFGRNLLRARKRARLSQETLAVRASLHRTEIGFLERGERLARIDTATKLAGALEVSVGSLLEDIEWRPGSTQAGAFAPIAPERKGRNAKDPGDGRALVPMGSPEGGNP